MNSEAILTVSAAVVALTQLTKWSGIPDKFGPLAVLVLALAGVSFWGWSQGDFTQASAFGYFAGWISVAMSAAGAFGFTRATASALTSATPPPNDGAGSSYTVKETTEAEAVAETENPAKVPPVATPVSKRGKRPPPLKKR